MSINPFTFRNSSYGFVDMLTLEDAEGLFELLSGTAFLDRPLQVKPCVQKSNSHSQSRSQQLSATRWRGSP
jgi:RNA recognition motif-containing protein